MAPLALNDTDEVTAGCVFQAAFTWRSDDAQDQEKTPEEVRVLHGNPHQVVAVADALQFEHKYTSGVIA